MADPGEINWDGRNDGPEPWDAPASTSERRKIEQALLTPVMGRGSVRRIRNPLPQIQLNPRRHGFTNHTPGIGDILEETRDYQPVVDWSGGIGAYSGTDRNTLGTV